MKLDELDPNFKINEASIKDNMVYLEARSGPFEVHGMLHNSPNERYVRIPEEIISNDRKELLDVSRYTAGGCIRFSTNSGNLDVFVKYNREIWKMPHMTLIGSAGMDLYVEDSEGVSRFYGPIVPTYQNKEGYSGNFTFDKNKWHNLTLYFPLYAEVKEVIFGLDKDSEVKNAPKFDKEDPILFYGSSITNGGCASRPGLAYTSIIARRMNLDHINLGFSGNAKGEDYMASYIADQKMSAFIYDYDHNAPTVEHLAKTHLPFLRTILNKHPNLPVVMVSRPIFKKSKLKDATERYSVIEQTYTTLKNEGYNVAIVDGRQFFPERYMNDCTADGTHPNDLGFAYMADKVEQALREIMN